MKLKITSFVYSRTCNNSTLQIRDGQNSSGEAFEPLCGLGGKTKTLFSSGRHLWVQLQSSHDNQAGIFAVFEAVKQCKC